MKYLLFTVSLVVSLYSSVSTASSAKNAEANGKGWISLGVPSKLHMGTEGSFFLNGTNQGKCGGVSPTYFRMDMSQPHFKEFYSWLLYMRTQNKPLDCVVQRGCGTSDVWVRYCRGVL